ncbi:hypothetical protein [Novosphingobium sp.]|uniref:hypothetical protein n=1 Tax=Novosphingobium sp. TaxID=1874826 RepID=UPI00286E6E99|nr:hypothetical protein [Novosphingobium sp.]
MKRVPTRRRGQPIIALGIMLCLWTGGRVIAVSLPIAAPETRAPEWLATPAIGEGSAAVLAPRAAATVEAAKGNHASALPTASAPFAQPLPMPAASPLLTAPEPGGQTRPLATPATAPTVAPALPEPSPIPPAMRPNPTLSGGHQLLFLAALSQVPLPEGLLAARAAPPKAATPQASRWSGDGWLLLRRGGGVPALAAIGGSYGASQAGMVLRYRIDLTSPNRPSLYLRASAALNGSREQEAALGLAARPISRLPVLAMAEARATRTPTGTRLRPAAALVTELPVASLPLGFRAEAYGQVGWVGGTGATTFVDGQLRLEKPLARFAGGDLSAGGGLWGGAQKDASRLDAGPSARLTLHPTRQSTVRVAADWRFRIAGKAAPQSGPAITLSAGF